MERLDLDSWEQQALARLSPMTAGYYAGGSREEQTLRDNRSAWSSYRLRHRILADVSSIDTSCEIAGLRLSMPIIAAPTAFHGLAHAHGEAETARGGGRGDLDLPVDPVEHPGGVLRSTSPGRSGRPDPAH